MKNSSLLSIIPILFLILACGCGGSAGKMNPLASEEKSPLDGKTPAAPLVVDRQLAERLDPKNSFLLGIDRLRLEDYRPLWHKRVVLVTNSSALDKHGIHTVERLYNSPKVTVGATLILEDDATSATTALESALALRPDISTHWLTPEAFRPTGEMLRDADAIVYDAAIEGVRSGIATVGLIACLEEASLRGKDLFVLDRPSITDPNRIMGPPADADALGSRVGMYPVPLYVGATSGELALLMNTTFGLDAWLKVVEMNQWSRTDGNAWMREPADRNISERGRQNLAELELWRWYQPGAVDLWTVMDLQREGDWAATRLEVSPETPARLLLAPARNTIDRAMTSLNRSDSAGVDITSASLEHEGDQIPAIAITAAGDAPIDTLLLSLQLRFAAVSDVGNYPTEELGGPYANREVYQLIVRGLDPEQIANRMNNAPEVRLYREQRGDYLLYQ